MDNNQISNRSSFLSRILTFTQTLFQQIKKRPLIAILILMLILIGIFNFRYEKLKKKTVSNLETNYVGNVLLVLDARLDNAVSPSSLSLRFSYPVSTHDLSHYFSITPKIPGKWEIDKKDNRVINYKFDNKYKGSYLSLYISQGLTSLNNKTLLNDYETYFTLNSPRTYEPYARVKSFPAGKDIPVATDIDSFSVYKSNAYNLLSFLSYSISDKKKRGSVYDGEYTKDTIEHASADKLQNLKAGTEENTILLDPGVYTSFQ